MLSGHLPQELSSESEVNFTTCHHSCHTLRLDTSNPCSIVADEKNGDPLVAEEILGVGEHLRVNKRSICI